MALRLRRGTDAERAAITFEEGELVYATDTKQVYVGDGSTLGGVNLITNLGQSGDLLEDITPQLGGDLDLNEFDVIGTGNIDITGAIAADDIVGDLTGSVFADDGVTALVDGVTGTITATGGIVLSGVIEADNAQTLDFASNFVGDTLSISGVTSGTFGTESSITLDAAKGTLDTPQDTVANDIIGAVKVRGYNNGNYVLGSLQQTFWDASADFGETYPKSGWRLAANAGDGKGTLLREDGITPSGFNHMTLRGDGVLEGPIFKMNVVADATARDALITAPEAGMTVFVTDGDGAGNPKFQGYDGSAWIDLN